MGRTDILRLIGERREEIRRFRVRSLALKPQRRATVEAELVDVA